MSSNNSSSASSSQSSPVPLSSSSSSSSSYFFKTPSLKSLLTLALGLNLAGISIWVWRSEVASLFLQNIRQLLSLIVIVSGGILGGQIASEFGHDSMLGMLGGGVLLRNVFPFLIAPIPHAWTSILWTIALCSVISRAGLSLQKSLVLPHLYEAALLGSVPVLTEASIMALIVKYLFNLPTEWAYTVAFGVASISPGVVVPLILKMLDNGWQKSRLPPLLLTALGLDVLIGTSGFGIALASCFGHMHEQEDGDSSIHNSWVYRGLEEVAVGMILGTFIASISYGLIRIKGMADPSSSITSMLVFTCSVLGMLWCKNHGLAGAASCSTFITWGVVANTWSRIDIERADQRLKSIWLFFKPFLFPVIGATVSLYDIPFSTLLKAILAVLISMSVKGVTAYFITQSAGLEKEESWFISGLWTGKASIQATLCSAALAMVHHLKMDKEVEHEYAKIVFLCMVSSIVLGITSASTWMGLFGGTPVGIDLSASLLTSSNTDKNNTKGDE